MFGIRCLRTGPKESLMNYIRDIDIGPEYSEMCVILGEGGHRKHYEGRGNIEKRWEEI